MSRLATIALTCTLLTTSVGCFQSRWAGYGGGGCCAPAGGGVYGAPAGGGYMAPQSNYYSPTGMGTPMNGPTAYYSTPVYGSPVPTTALAPMDPLPTY
ncbi:MAG: hypothetical protein ACE37I_04390 [Rubinisphaera brasiliensis]|uniref:Lipoprotein n=1 Tax=Rubinisphaera brasiliensis (strain ATCC 49424 / DSM 5305 / JCM 21570 / IAM 15109 / NBRC 103401 / IFAM 1448) TaxID=756272 RepID=F0SJD0_RUBBR|nr:MULTISPECIES: hypothetical protein [Rubinisphaera]ADY59705.1 hypothetical protein Plabr_2102 [Rubinisphaera brasiliensis DSM 5305]MBR9803214.1 hypothetical protein [bacterium]